MTYSFGMLFMSLVKVLVPGFFARQDTRTPVRVGMVALGLNVGLNLAIVLPAAHAGFPAPHALLAISTSLSAALNTVLLLQGLRKAGVYSPAAGWPALMTRIVMANAGDGRRAAMDGRLPRELDGRRRPGPGRPMRPLHRRGRGPLLRGPICDGTALPARRPFLAILPAFGGFGAHGAHSRTFQLAPAAPGLRRDHRHL